MSLKAVLFDFNGVIIKDEIIHRQLTEEMLLAENLVVKPGEFKRVCLGRSDRACFKELLEIRGRVISDEYLAKLLSQKTTNYAKILEKLEELPLYPGVKELISQIHSENLKLGLVSAALRKDIELVLGRANLTQDFEVLVSAEDVATSKPESEGYLLAVELLKEKHPELELQPEDCLAIEDTPAGIQSAKNAGMQVLAVAHAYPFHMLQRQANWTVDYFNDIELERIKSVFRGNIESSAEES